MYGYIYPFICLYTYIHCLYTYCKFLANLYLYQYDADSISEPSNLGII